MIVFTGKQGFDFGIIHLGLQIFQSFANLIFYRFAFLRELKPHFEIIDFALISLKLIDDFVQTRAPLQHGLRFLLILPEIFSGNLLFNFLKLLLFLFYFKDNLEDAKPFPSLLRTI